MNSSRTNRTTKHDLPTAVSPRRTNCAGVQKQIRSDERDAGWPAPRGAREGGKHLEVAHAGRRHERIFTPDGHRSELFRLSPFATSHKRLCSKIRALATRPHH